MAKQKVSGNSLNQIASICHRSFPSFIEYTAKTLIGLPPPPFHYTLAEFMQGTEPKYQHRFKKVMGFRLSAKTTVAGRWYCMWRLLRNPYTQIRIISSSDSLAEAMVKAFLDSMRAHPLLRHLVPDGKFSERQFNLKGAKAEQGFGISCCGVESRVTSGRSDILLFDDPEPNESPEGMRELIIAAFAEADNILHSPDRHIGWWQGQGYASVPIPDRTQLIVLGQPHWEGTAYYPNDVELDPTSGEVHPLAGCASLKIPICDKTETYWTWPHMMKTKYYNVREKRPETVKEVKSRTPMKVWMCQQLCNPRYAENKGQVLDLNNLHLLVANPSRIIAAIDPADGAGCEWGVAIGGTVNRKFHLMHIAGFLGEAYDWIDNDGAVVTQGYSTLADIFATLKLFRVDLILLERNLASSRTAIRKYMRATHTTIPMLEHTARANKLRRICNTLQPVINGGMVSMAPNVFQDIHTRKQFSKLQYNKLPEPCDRIDATEMLISYLIENQEYDVIGDTSIPSIYNAGRYNGDNIAVARRLMPNSRRTVTARARG